MSPFPPPKLKYKLAVIDIQEQRLARIALWRSCLITGFALGLGLLATSTHWTIKHQSQIQIVGKKLVNADTIYTALNFVYPQFIWTVDGSNLTQKIESIPAIEVARINKQIIPSQLTVYLQERTPVALATSQVKVGFIYVHGEWIANEFYAIIDSGFVLPQLAVLNYLPKYKRSWIQIYQLISLYPELKINEVQWNHDGNLFVQTKIGRVLLGTDSSRLEQQFKIMLKLQNLPAHIKRREIAYVDLSNPKTNLIQRY